MRHNKAAWRTPIIRMQRFCIRMWILMLNSTNIRNSNYIFHYIEDILENVDNQTDDSHWCPCYEKK